MKKTYTYDEVIVLVRKAYTDAADALRPWVYGDGPDKAIQERMKIALDRIELKGEK